MSKKVWTKHRNVKLIISSDVTLKENSTSKKEPKLSVEVDKLQPLLMTKTLRIKRTLECSVSKSCAWGKREVHIREMELVKKMVLAALMTTLTRKGHWQRGYKSLRWCSSSVVSLIRSLSRLETHKQGRTYTKTASRACAKRTDSLLSSPSLTCQASIQPLPFGSQKSQDICFLS